MQIDLDNLAKASPTSERVENSCITQSSKQFGINPLVIKAIRLQEAGQTGMASKNPDGSYDIGIMQLNTINLGAIQKQYPKVTLADLLLKPCVNIFVATWFLNEKIKEANGDMWKGVGNYHSKTPQFHTVYLNKVLKKYKVLRDHYIENQKRRRNRSRTTVIGIYKD